MRSYSHGYSDDKLHEFKGRDTRAINIDRNKRANVTYIYIFYCTSFYRTSQYDLFS